MNESYLNKSLYLQSLNKMYDLLDKICLDPDTIHLGADSIHKMFRDIAKCHKVMSLISMHNQYKGREAFNVPYWVEGIEGEC